MLQNLKEKTVRFLRWSEKYTKTDMVYLAKGGGWLAFGKAFQTLAGLGLAIGFANLLPQETYGSYKYIISLASVIGIFSLNGLGTAITQATARGYEGSLRHGFKEMFRWSIGLVVVALGCAGYYYLQGNVEFAAAMVIIAVSYPILKSSGLYQSFLDGKKEFKTRSMYLIIWEIIEVGALILTLLLSNSLLTILAVFFATNSVPPLLLYFRTLQKYQPSDELDPETAAYSKHLSVINAIRTIGNHIDKVLVFQFIGPMQLAIYSFAVLPVEKAWGLLGSIQILALPKFSANKKEVLQKTLPKKILPLLIFCFLLLIIFLLVIPHLFELIFPRYLKAIPYAQVYSVIFLLYPAMLFEQALTAQAEEKALYMVSLSENIIKIILILVLLPLYGIWGGVSALILTKLIKVVLSTYFFYKM